MSRNYLVLILIICASWSTLEALNNKTFPKNFKFGSATASYQIEGGWNADGKGENIWDELTHKHPELIKNHDNGDIACDSYHKYKEDVSLLKDLGVDYYRFSLSWSRIIPTGKSDGKVNEAGVQYYKNLIGELKSKNIEPMVTLYHWDLPQRLQEEYQGFLSEKIIDDFASFARLAFKLFGSDVKTWVTFNEPKQVCLQGYGTGTKAPAIVNNGIGEYICTHNLLKAHAKAYHIYDQEFRGVQKGRISIVLDSDWIEPESASREDVLAADTRLQFALGWFAHPIIIGNYPKVMIDNIRKRSEKEGFKKSRLPEFTPDEIKSIKGTFDFFGLNHYTTNMAKAVKDPPIDKPSWQKDIGGVAIYQDKNWESTVTSWLKMQIVPWGVRKLLRWLQENYNNPEIIITENGVADNGTLKDKDIREHYYKEYLSNILYAITDDGVNVTGHTAWSLLDNFEWMVGYSQKFGLYHVDFNSPNRTRTPKDSVAYLKKVYKTRCLVDNCEKN